MTGFVIRKTFLLSWLPLTIVQNNFIKEVIVTECTFAIFSATSQKMEHFQTWRTCYQGVRIQWDFILFCFWPIQTFAFVLFPLLRWHHVLNWEKSMCQIIAYTLCLFLSLRIHFISGISMFILPRAERWVESL